MLLDLGLPDMDGLDVLSQLSGLPQEVPVIIISARDRESEKVKALDMGADDYVVKPFGVPSCWPVSALPCAGLTACAAAKGCRKMYIRSRILSWTYPSTR